MLSAEDLAGACQRLYGERTYTAHRADLHNVIASAVPAGTVRLGRRCTGVSVRGDRVVLGFDDGSTAEADVVIGADGVHSAVRGAVTEALFAQVPGICAFRAIVPADRAPQFARRRAQTLWIGPGRHLVHYPVSAETAVNLVAFAPAGDYTDRVLERHRDRRGVPDEFAGWDKRLRDLIRQAERQAGGH